MIFSTITQNNLNLTADTTEIPAQYSNNIQFKFIQDNERFSGYIPTIYIGVYDSAMIECSDVINAGGAVVVDGDGVFAISNEIMYRNGFLAVGVTLTNNDENVSLKPVIYRIQASVGGLSPLPPDEGEWQQVVKAFVETLFNNWSAENLDPIKAQLEELISTAQTQQEKITSQQTQIDNAIGNMGDYEIVQEDPVQIRFKKGDGTFGETVDLGDGLASKAMVNAGYYTYKDISYGGSASNNGIDVAEIDGAYSQETTNGFQLFDASKLPTKSQGGATVTNNDDGSFTISGSGTLSEDFSITYSATNMVNYLKQGNIILDCVNTSYPYVEIQLKKEDSSNLIVLTNRSNAENSANITQEILSQISKIWVYIYGVKDGVIGGGIIKPMLYQDGDGTFEPFTGGIASPNPEYPQEPKFVGDIGQNLFDASKLPTKSQGGATVTNNGDGSFTVSGSGNLSEACNVSYKIEHDQFVSMFKAGKIYMKVETTTLPYLYAQIYKGSAFVKTLFITQSQTEVNGEILQEYLEDPSYVMIVGINGGSTAQIKAGTVKPMLYQDGDGEYRPFSETPKYYLDFVTSGKNLFDKNDIIDGKRVDAKGIVTINGAKISNYIKVRPNTQYYLANVIGLSTWYTGGYFDKDKKFISQLNVSGSFPTSGKITTPINCYYIVLNILVNNNLLDVDNTIISFGSTPIDYEPFTGFETTTVQLNQPLRELPNGVKDTIENGVVTRRVGCVDLGDFDYVDYSNYNGYYTAVGNLKSDNYGEAICTHFKVIKSHGEMGIRIGAGNSNIYIEQVSSVYPTASEFKSAMSGVILFYELATPTTEQITLPTLPSWYPYTDAWVETELQPSFVEWHIKTAGANQNDLTVIKEDISQLQTETTQLNDDVTKLMGAFTSVTDLTKQLFLLMHRVGDIIFSTSDENPSTIYGGTWVAWGKGQVPVGVDTSDSDFNTVEKTGGEKEHTLTVDEMPSHSHIQTWNGNIMVGGGSGGESTNGSYLNEGGNGTYPATLTNNVGNSHSHNNLQPYITCYMWKRTA